MSEARSKRESRQMSERDHLLTTLVNADVMWQSTLFRRDGCRIALCCFIDSSEVSACVGDVRGCRVSTTNTLDIEQRQVSATENLMPQIIHAVLDLCGGLFSAGTVTWRRCREHQSKSLAEYDEASQFVEHSNAEGLLIITKTEKPAARWKQAGPVAVAEWAVDGIPQRVFEGHVHHVKRWYPPCGRMIQADVAYMMRLHQLERSQLR
jgi:hypothetical protein